jgi:cytochrome P450
MTEAPELPLHMRRDGLDPAGELARVRDTEGVTRVMMPTGVPAYLVCRYEDVREMLSDPVRFSSARTKSPGRSAGADLSDEEHARLRAGTLLLYDPPEHPRLRRMLTAEFTVRRMRRLEPRIAEIVEAALDDLQRAGKPADLVRHFALPVPLLVICELLGVSDSERAEFHDRSARLLDLSLPMEQHIAAHQDNRDYMAELVARAQAEPGEDLLGMLVREHGNELSRDELVGIAAGLLIGGHETTSSMLGLGTLALLRHPDQLAMVRDDPAQVQPAVEELLRWLSVVPCTGRTTTTEVEIAGHTIPAGSTVLVSLPAANRDPSCARDPGRLDITRGAPGHVTFGHGAHRCLGAPLAQMEMCIAFPALLRRFPGLALAEPDEDVTFRPFGAVYGLQSLQVTW